MSRQAEIIAAAIAKVEELSNPEVLSVLDYIENEGIVMPKETITFFLDLESSIAARNLRTELETAQSAAAQMLMQARAHWDNDEARSVADQPPVLDQFLALDPIETQGRIDALNKKVYDSRIVFNLRGISPATQREVGEQVEAAAVAHGETFSEQGPDAVTAAMKKFAGDAMDAALVALTVQSVEIPAKAQTLSALGPADVKALLKKLPEKDIDRFYAVVNTLNDAAVLVDPVVDAGFPGERAGVTQEPEVRDVAEGGESVGGSAD